MINSSLRLGNSFILTFVGEAEMGNAGEQPVEE
jgi:hypothetical protein